MREDVARAVIIRGIRDTLIGKAALAYIRRELAKALGSIGAKVEAELSERRKRLARVEKQIRGLVSFIADGDQSAYVRQSLVDLEGLAQTEKAAILALEAEASAPVALPSLDMARSTWRSPPCSRRWHSSPKTRVGAR